MFASVEVLIGLALVYLLLALIVTALTEWGASAFKYRATNLRKAVRQMLDGPSGPATNTDRFYRHPRIVAISDGVRPPSYIPSKTFAEVVTGLLSQDPPLDSRTVPILAGKDADIEALEERFLDTMNRASGWYKRRAIAMSAAWAAVVVIAANADTLSIAQTLWSSPSVRAAIVAQAERRVAMGRPRGVVDANYADPDDPVPPLSDESAENQDPDTLLPEDRAALDLLLGWKAAYKAVNDPHCERLQQERDAACRDERTDQACHAVLERIAADDRCEIVSGALAATATYPGDAISLGVMGPLVFSHLLGWLLSIAAVSLGAPFWFDTLSRFVNLRGAGPAEKPRNKGDLKATNEEKKP